MNRGGASVEVFTALEATDEWGDGDIGLITSCSRAFQGTSAYIFTVK